MRGERGSVKSKKATAAQQNRASSVATEAASATSSTTGAEAAQRRGDFVLMSYEALRAEVLYHLEQLPKIEQLAMIVTASVFSWMAVKQHDISSFGAVMFIWLVPLFVTIFCFYRHQVAQLAVRNIADFIALKLAPEMDATTVCWEEQMRQARMNTKGSHLFRISNRIFWGGLIGVDLLAPLLFAPFWAGWSS